MDKNPLVTLIIFAYKAEKFIAETIDGALSQTYDNLEIIVSDDCSPDGTAQVIKDKLKDYNGPHKVIININETNMGIVKHMNKLFSMANGEIIATNPGDDVSTPNRITDTVEYFTKNSSLQMVTFSRIDVNEHNFEIGGNIVEEDEHFRLDDKYIKTSGIMFGGTAVAFKKSLLNIFGYLNDDAQTEDSTMRFRAILAGGVIYSHKIGLKYRIHGNNISIGIGQYRFKFDLITKQYKDDVKKAEIMGLISKNVGRVLRLKIDNDLMNRLLGQLIASNADGLAPLYYKIRKKIYNIIFKIKISCICR